MAAGATSRILVCASETAAVDDVRRMLEQAGHTVVCQPLAAAGAEGGMLCDLVILDSSRHAPEALHACRRLRVCLADAFVPLLYVTPDTDPALRLAGLENGADTCLVRPFAAAELLAQVQALVRLQVLHDRLTARASEFHGVTTRLQPAYQQTDQELDPARRIQQSMLTPDLPARP